MKIPPDPSKRRYSASQLSLYLACPRKYWHKYVDGVPEIPSAAALLGKEVHSLCEALLLGAPPPLATPAAQKIAAAAVLHLPPPQTEGLLVEHGFIIDIPEIAEDVQLIGYIDIAMMDGSKGVRTIIEPDIPAVLDIKTRSDFRYIKTPQELREDLQLLIYAHAAFEQLYPDAKEMTIGHIYTRTRGASAATGVYATVSRSDAALHWHGYVVPLIAQMQTARLAWSAQTLLPNPEECDKYGGCPHKASCGFVGLTSTGGNSMGLKEDLAERRRQQEQLNSSSLNTLTESSTSPVKVEQTTRSESSATGRSIAEASPPPLRDDELSCILPPDAPPREMTPGEQAGLAVGEFAAWASKVPLSKKGRKGKAPCPAPMVDTSAPVMPASAPMVDTSAPVMPASAPVMPASIILYVDCRPTKGSADVMYEFDEWMLESAAAAAAAWKVDDWRIIEYGKGPGALAFQFRQRMANLPSPMHVSMRSPGADVFLQVAARFATTIVRGDR